MTSLKQRNRFNSVKTANNNLSSRNHRQKKLKRMMTKLLLYLAVVTVLLITSLSYNISLSDFSVIKNFTKLPVINSLSRLVSTFSLGGLNGLKEDRINVLLLGQGGPGHPGPYLTDTIILSSFKPSTGQLALLSIPRDFLVKLPTGQWVKINSVNAFGETETPNEGGELVSQVVEQTLGLPIHYWIRLDFDGFIRLIDALGGIEVYVEKSFTDYRFPDDKNGFKTVSFTVGRQLMDGQRALQYARSRHGTAGEGSDFARARRQQQVLKAIKNKVLSSQTLLNPQKLINLIKFLDNSLQTNIKFSEIDNFLNLLSQADTQHIITYVLDDSPQGLLKSSVDQNGSYVLVPKSDDLGEIQILAQNIFTLSETPTSSVIIKNGTLLPGLAQEVAGLLKKFGFQILSFSNADNQNYKQTLIYDLTGGEKKKALNLIKQQLGGQIRRTLPPTETTDNQADFIIILGQDQNSNQ